MLFEERGWLGARVEDIARAAGVSAATAYNHFPTKHALVGHVYGPRVRPAIDETLARLADGDDITRVLDDHTRELASIFRKNLRLTIAFVDAVLEYTIRIGGPPEPGDRMTPGAWRPCPRRSPGRSPRDSKRASSAPTRPRPSSAPT